MPPVSPIVDDGTYAVNTADVSVVYKTILPEIPPAPAVYCLVVILRGIGKPQSPQLHFMTALQRDAFYDDIVEAMKA